MSLTRVATFKDVKKKALELEISGKKVQMSHGDLSLYNTASAVEEVIEARAGLAGVILPRVHVHINRDGSLAVATGVAPEVWPEDAAIADAEVKHG